MKNEFLYTKEDERAPKKIPAKDGYLMLLAYVLKRHHNAHYHDEYSRVPIKLCIEYIKYLKSYRQLLHTELKKLNGLTAEKFTKAYKERLNLINENRKKQAVDNFYAFIVKELAKRSPSVSFNYIENSHLKYQPLKDLLKLRADDNNITSIPELPDYLLPELLALVKDVAKSDLKIKALEHAHLHIDLTGTYNFKKLADSIQQVYELMGCPVIKSKDEIKVQVKNAVEGYEIENNIDFIMDDALYYQSIYNNFKNKVK